MSENIVTLKIEDIILDPNINTREIDSEIVVEYQESINGYHRQVQGNGTSWVVQGNGTSWQDHWNELPRITKSNHLWSGFHTVTAAREVFSGGEIRCIVEGETYRDAYFLATGTNTQHGRRRSNEEKRIAVNRWLEDGAMNLWTDSHIAKQCLVTHVFVGKRRLESISSQPTKRKFINAKGEVEWMHTTRIGKTRAVKPSPPDPPSSSPAFDLDKQRETDYKAFVKHRDAAYNAWKACCEQHEIPFDWSDFCLYAESHLDGIGCLSLPSPNTSTLDEIREKSLTVQKMKSAISHGAKWVVSHRTGLDFTQKQKAKESQAEPIPAEEEGPDLQGLKEEIYDLLDEEGRICVPELAHKHSVPLDEAESIVAQAKTDVKLEAAEKRKEALMNEYDDLTSESQHLWGKHLKRFISWDELFATAQGNWMALKNSHDYSPADESEESLKLQIAIWKNFKADLEYTVRVIKREGAERGQIWLLKLLVIKPKEEKPQEPTWIQIIVHGQHHTGEVDRHVFRVDTPMADEYMVLIGNAAMEAAKEAYTRISTERTEEEA